MAAPIFYHESVELATLTENSIGEDSDFPLDNLKERNEAHIFKAGTANTSGYIQINFGAVRSVNYVILGAHNYTSTSIGIKVAYDDNDNGAFSSIEYVVGSSGAYEDYTSGDADRWLETFSGIDRQYWRVYLEAQGASTYQEIGALFMGTYIDAGTTLVEKSRPYGKGHTANVDVLRFDGGGSHANRHSELERIWSFGFEQMVGDTAFDAIETLIRESYNGHLPIYFDPDGDGTLYPVRIENNPFSQQEQRYQVHNTDALVLREEP